NQNIPNNAPISDEYIYYGYVGDYPAAVIDSSYFPFEVTAKAVGRPGVSDWTLTGSFLEASEVDLPTEFSLSSNYPNPFNAKTVIEYQLPQASDVKLEVYNLLGEKVATLVDGEQNAGYRSAAWDASAASSGVYFYKLTAGDFTDTERMILVK
ncbi:MAG: T9SS type A sorting domain-containing protein, partial [Candidatus Zixiibacteriota bacterium]